MCEGLNVCRQDGLWESVAGSSAPPSVERLNLAKFPPSLMASPASLTILVVPDPVWTKSPKDAKDGVEWATCDFHPDHEKRLLQCKALESLVYAGNPETIPDMRQNYKPLLIHEKILMWSWLEQNAKCTVEFESFLSFRKRLMAFDKNRGYFKKYSCVWGGVDLMVDPKFANISGLRTRNEVQKYMDNLQLLQNVVPIWPPPLEIQKASRKLWVIQHLDEIAHSVTQTPRPITLPLLCGWPQQATGKVVIKREGSDCGHHVKLEPSNQPLESNDDGFLWFSQTRIDTLLVIGEWRVITANMCVLYIVNTVPVEGNTEKLDVSQHLYGLSLAEMSEKMNGHYLPDDIIDPPGGTLPARKAANTELESFSTDTLHKLIELEEAQLNGGESSLRLSARLDIGVMRDERGRMAYFVNEVERGISTALYSHTRLQNALCYADTYFLAFKQWMERRSK
ncbi:hypothetical protein JVU11DRAFT_9340 [Chiua virens]|nr:hypothetical protein JVU11DRAFT_9340 [Chiua virens]